MSGSVLFDAPGPRTRVRHVLYSVAAGVVVLVALGAAAWRLYDADQFAGEKWEVFVTPDYVRIILLDGVVKTLQMAAASIAGAVVFGALFGIGKLSDHAWVRWPSWAVVELFRAIPVLLMMVFTWYALGPTGDNSFRAVVVALTVYNGAVLAEVLRAGVLAVPKGQSEAAYALGMRKSQVMVQVLVPQAVKIMLPAIISQCIVALKDTALGLYVLAPGLTFIYRQLYLEFNNRVPTMIVVAGLYIVINLLLTALANWAQRRYVGERRQLVVPMTGSADQRTV
ncbi:amino acid ABC transporter permease [Nocardioides litoris]|uniref:amino acid ABC transporter permease n=1 Tax=Nocardioides litoris TaxID=1926648 RepID=UPI001123CCDF|nr:amino acid ABC transporter permease [Nocardioides litoris]